MVRYLNRQHVLTVPSWNNSTNGSFRIEWIGQHLHYGMEQFLNNYIRIRVLLANGNEYSLEV